MLLVIPSLGVRVGSKNDAFVFNLRSLLYLSIFNLSIFRCFSKNLGFPAGTGPRPGFIEADKMLLSSFPHGL